MPTQLDIWKDYVTVINAQRLNAMRNAILSNENSISTLEDSVNQNANNIAELRNDVSNLSSLQDQYVLTNGSRQMTGDLRFQAHHGIEGNLETFIRVGGYSFYGGPQLVLRDNPITSELAVEWPTADEPTVVMVTQGGSNMIFPHGIQTSLIDEYPSNDSGIIVDGCLIRNGIVANASKLNGYTSDDFLTLNGSHVMYGDLRFTGGAGIWYEDDDKYLGILGGHDVNCGAIYLYGANHDTYPSKVSIASGGSEVAKFFPDNIYFERIVHCLLGIEGSLHSNWIYEQTDDSGVNVDGCLIKDGYAANASSLNGITSDDIYNLSARVYALEQGSGSGNCSGCVLVDGSRPMLDDLRFLNGAGLLAGVDDQALPLSGGLTSAPQIWLHGKDHATDPGSIILYGLDSSNNPLEAVIIEKGDIIPHTHFYSQVHANIINENSDDHGVYVDGCLIKDGYVANASSLNGITSADIFNMSEKSVFVDGCHPMLDHLRFENDAGIQATFDNHQLLISAGENCPAQIKLYGKDHPSSPGNMVFLVPSSDGNQMVKAIEVEGFLFWPKIRVYADLLVDALYELWQDHGITIDGCLIKDGYAANASSLCGITSQYIHNLSERVSDLEQNNCSGCLLVDGSRHMQGNLQFDGGYGISPSTMDQQLPILAGNPDIGWSPGIWLFGKDYSGDQAGRIEFWGSYGTDKEQIAKAFEIRPSQWYPVTKFYNAVQMDLVDALYVNKIEEYDNESGVTIDGCLIKDGKVANASRLNDYTGEEFLTLNGSRVMYGDLRFTGGAGIWYEDDDKYLGILGGHDTHCGAIYLYGASNETYPSKVTIASGGSEVAKFFPYNIYFERRVQCELGIEGTLHSNWIFEQTDDHGVNIDGCLIKDGYAANASSLNGITSYDIHNLSSQVSQNTEVLASLDVRVAQNTTNIDNLSERVYDLEQGGGGNNSNCVLVDGSREIIGTLQFADCAGLQSVDDHSYLPLYGGANCPGAIKLFGKDYEDMPGGIQFLVSNTDTQSEVARFIYNESYPEAHFKADVRLSRILELDSDEGVTIDGCLIKDGYVANASSLCGITSDNIYNLSSRTSNLEADVGNLESSLYNLSGEVYSNSQLIDSLEQNVAENTTDISNLSSLQDDYLTLNGSRIMYGDLKLTDGAGIWYEADDQYLGILGGHDIHCGAIYLYGANHDTYPSKVSIASGGSEVAKFFPSNIYFERYVHCEAGIEGALHSNWIYEQTSDHGVYIDDCLIKDGYAANASSLNGITSLDILNLSSRVSQNTEVLSSLNLSVAQNTTNIDNLSERVYDLEQSGGSNNSNCVLIDGSREIIGTLQFTNYAGLRSVDDRSYLPLYGGTNCPGAIKLFGKNYEDLPGGIQFLVSNKDTQSEVACFVCNTTYPEARFKADVKLSRILELNSDEGVTIDGCLIKDGHAANTSSLCGITSDDIFNLSSRTYTLETDVGNLESSLYNLSSEVYSNSQSIDNLEQDVARNTTDIANLSSLQDDYLTLNGSRVMYGDLRLTGGAGIWYEVDDQYLGILGGHDVNCGAVYLYGANHDTYPSKVAIASGGSEVAKFFPSNIYFERSVHCELGIEGTLHSNWIYEQTNNHGVNIDGCLIKDGYAANASTLNGITSDDFFNLSSRTYNLEVDVANLETDLYNLSGQVYSNTQNISNLDNRVTQNEDSIDQLEQNVAKNTTDISNLSSLQDDYLTLNGSRAMTGDIRFQSGGNIKSVSTEDVIKIIPGDSTGGQIWLYGCDNSDYPCAIRVFGHRLGFDTPMEVMRVFRTYNVPWTHFYHPVSFGTSLEVNRIYEYSNNSGVTVDNCLIKDGYAANASELNGITSDDIYNLSARVYALEQNCSNPGSDIGSNLSARIYNLESKAFEKKRPKNRNAKSEVPINASSVGTPGELAFDENYLYVCVKKNRWKRIKLEDW